MTTQPYPWPYDGDADPGRLALVVVGAQGWWCDRTADAAGTLATIEQAAKVVRDAGGVVVVVRHTGIDGDGLAFSVEPADVVVTAAGISGFCGGTLDATLRALGREQVVVAGLGIESAVYSTLGSANDRGYECLLLADACAPHDPSVGARAAASVTMSGGIFGAVGTTSDLCDVLEEAQMSDLPGGGGPRAGAGGPNAAAGLRGPNAIAGPDDAWMRGQSSTAWEEAQPKAPKRRVGTPFRDGDRVDAEPYPWPYDGALETARTALLLIDWQHDFCGRGGYVDAMGYDLKLTRAGLEPTARVLAAARKAGMAVIHTREGHLPDLSDCPPNKLWRSRRVGAGIGDPGPCGRTLIRGEEGWEIVPEVAPIEGEVIIDKPGKGAFYATELDLVLRVKRITNLIFTGITTDVCVHTTMREANDRGYECLLLSDCTGATDYDNYLAALQMVKMQGGVFGAVADSNALLEALPG